MHDQVGCGEQGFDIECSGDHPDQFFLACLMRCRDQFIAIDGQRDQQHIIQHFRRAFGRCDGLCNAAAGWQGCGAGDVNQPGIAVDMIHIEAQQMTFDIVRNGVQEREIKGPGCGREQIAVAVQFLDGESLAFVQAFPLLEGEAFTGLDSWHPTEASDPRDVEHRQGKSLERLLIHVMDAGK